MHGFFLRWTVNTVALLAVVYLLPGIAVESWPIAALASLVLGFLNSFLRPILIFMTFPFSLLTLGLFVFIINAFIFSLTSKIVSGFWVNGFLNAFLGALLFSIISFALNTLIDPAGRINVSFYKRSYFKNMDDRIIDVEGKSKDDDDFPPKIPDL